MRLSGRGQVLHRRAEHAAQGRHRVRRSRRLIASAILTRDRETDPDIAARGVPDGGVDADQFTPQVDQWTTRVAGLIEASVWMKFS